MAVIQESSSWQLEASIKPLHDGYHLVVSSLVPTARRPEHQIKFQAVFTVDELKKLQAVIDSALAEVSDVQG